MSIDDIGWGILATGKIAQTFAHELALVPGTHLAAVGSRSQESADRFSMRYGGTAYGDYADLVADPEVDVVYVASPHALHPEHVKLAFAAGKPVLCEKALTLTAAQAEELVAIARERGLFFMEAMWTACHPTVRTLIDRFAAGDFGTPLQLTADLGWKVEFPPTDRMFAPELGGGALLDMGIYPLTFAQLFLGDPQSQTISAVLNENGIDLNDAITASYASGAVAALTTTMTASSPRTASIATNTGRIDIPAQFHHPTHALWTPYVDGVAGPTERIEPTEPIIGAGYGNEIAEVLRCLRAGELESPWVPHAQTLTIMRQMDALRAQAGIVYPGER